MGPQGITLWPHHVLGEANGLADALSREQWGRFGDLYAEWLSSQH